MLMWPLCMLLACVCMPTRAFASERVDALVQSMSCEEKISQLIIVPFRSWEGNNVRDLSACPDLAEALRSHQLGGVILFGQNVESGEQTARLVSDLQQNNARTSSATHVPYFTAIDQEGGRVQRLSWGCRMTGNMAIGATGKNARNNAFATGNVIGQEMAALGFNLNFAPVIDVNVNPANPVIGARSFSDDPQLVSELGPQYAAGLSANNVIATYKHFPGHGDVSADTHFGTAVVDKSLDELMSCELAPFAAVAGDADMIMTAHIVLPQVEEEVTLADGSVGYYPATLSSEVIGGLLRQQLGFEGVVVTDSLTMESVSKAHLVEGEEGSAAYGANVAQLALNAGVDMLLEPIDLTGADAASYLDEFIGLLAEKVAAGEIDQARVDEAVTRVLELKERRGVLDADTSGASLEQTIEQASVSVGSDVHHATEQQIAREAVTLVKNNGALPARDAKNIVLMGVDPDDTVALKAAVSQLQEAGLIAEDAFVRVLGASESSGSEASGTTVTIDYCCSTEDWNTPLYAGDLHYTDELRAAIAQADVVLALSRMDTMSWVQESATPVQAIERAIGDAHAAGASFVLLSDSLPYDLARYEQADAALAVYLYTGTAADPTERGAHNTRGGYNANILAGVEAAFGLFAPTGKLPVSIPTMEQDGEGQTVLGTETCYERGFGLSYEGITPAYALDSASAHSGDHGAGDGKHTGAGDKSGGINPAFIGTGIAVAAGVVAGVALLVSRIKR
ncbi:MAG: glycoside hydrolase family 3 N-terminal domain-containing protein [Coriobacteriales bacterium]|nr:glycoside hydrolase family 3 N-terminal domain-containing protein [Coriobacteriales bacterium]